MESTGEVAKPTTGSDGSVTEARSDSNVVERSETTNPPPPNAVAPPPPPPPPPQNPFPEFPPTKKKRGRPRKYPHDGATTAATLSPNPISTAAPMSQSHLIDFSAAAAERRERVIKPASTPNSSFIRTTKYQLDNFGLSNNGSGSNQFTRMPTPNYGHEWAHPSPNADFTPYIITVNAGEDLTKKIISFSQQGSLAICVLCANGLVSSVTLRQPDSSGGGTLTYEGRFEILSLSGSFTPSDSDGTRSRTGGMSVSLASPDGRVVGGSVAGLLVAATPIQVVLGSFAAGTNMPSPMPTTSNAHDHHHRPMSSSLHISTWSPPFPSHLRTNQSPDINITLT